MRISDRLKSLCTQQGWRIKDFADLTGLPYRTAQGYISGDREPNSDGMTILVEKLNINANWLLTGNGAIFIDSEIEDSKLNSDEKELITKFKKCNQLGKLAIKLNLNAISNEKMFKLDINL